MRVELSWFLVVIFLLIVWVLIVLLWVWMMCLSVFFLWVVYFFIVFINCGIRLWCCFSCILMLVNVFLWLFFNFINELYMEVMIMVRMIIIFRMISKFIIFLIFNVIKFDLKVCDLVFIYKKYIIKNINY